MVLINSGVTTDYLEATGKPQQKFKYWIASIMPAEFQAGYLLGKTLINKARAQKMGNKEGFIEVIAVNGIITDTPAQLRLAGLKLAIKEDGNSHLLQSVHAFWDPERAYYKVSHLQPRYPKATVYWVANDIMAISSYRALSELGLVQGEDYVTGGVDWSEGGLIAVQKKQISLSIGGHFMEGAWAVILLFDYFNSIDIEKNSAYQFQSEMTIISPDDAILLLPHIQNKDWKSINFRQHSKFYNKDIKQYPFSAKTILQALKN